MLSEVIGLILWFSLLVFISYLLKRLWVNSLFRWGYLVFCAPGIIIHEMSHYTACKLTGAKVTDVKLLSRDGGAVTHGPPRGGIFGKALISTAPFFGIPLFLILIALLFDSIEFFNCDLAYTGDLKGNLSQIILGSMRSAWELFDVNLLENRSLWFVLYLYLAASLTISMAPSGQDLKNSWIGIMAILVIAIGWSLLLDSVFSGWSAPVTNFIVGMLGWIVIIGLVLCMFGFVLGIPFFLLKWIRE